MLCHKCDTSPLIRHVCPIPERCCAQRQQQPALLQEVTKDEALFLQNQNTCYSLQG